MTSTATSRAFPGHTIIGLDEDLPVEERHDVYPTIDPTAAFINKTFAGKVVLITGASRGIGQETALHFARAGASLALVARKQETLDETKATILKEIPEAHVLTLPVDVKDSDQAAHAVEATVTHFGRLDVVIPNAGATTAMKIPLGGKDPKEWWNTFEVNILGVFNFVRPSVEHLQKTNGSIIAVSSAAAQRRLPFASDYVTSKHALGRLVEYISSEYPSLKVFALHPGGIRTQMADDAGVGKDVQLPDTAQLPASTMLYLAAGNADWLSGRYVSANWDLGEVERDWKVKILESHALVSKLDIPRA
ncbi:NAD-P-binding protein [Amylostereum chailletii]|nr:NAD-P-binding protein [Amylostereum chailletii]